MQQATQDAEVELTEFIASYYGDELAELVERYPSEQTWLTVSWSDLFAFDMETAEDYLESPDVVNAELSAAVVEANDHPVDLTDGAGNPNVSIRMVGLNDADIYTPLEVTRDVEDRDEDYVGVRGDLAKVTTPKKEIQTAAFECQRCGTMTYVPQEGDEFAEPHECQGCERQGPSVRS